MNTGTLNIKNLKNSQIIRTPKMNRRVADSALLPYERQGSIVTYVTADVTAVASAEKGARCALIFILEMRPYINFGREFTKTGK